VRLEVKAEGSYLKTLSEEIPVSIFVFFSYPILPREERRGFKKEEKPSKN
jgi:hypothetical protein